MKELKDMTFDELVESNTQRIHSGLLLGGGKEMQSATHYAMMLTLQWRSEKDKV